MPFSTEDFLAVFGNYNSGVFPFQVILLLAGIIVLFLLKSPSDVKDTFINIFLVVLWLWNGIVYHFLFFTKINPAAYIFSAIFIIQAFLFIYSGFVKRNLSFNFSGGLTGFLGLFMIIFGLLIYPLIGFLLLGDPGKVILIGLPCPSVIITFGLFLLTAANFPRYLLIIPTIWALIGFTAVINFGIYQDAALLLSAVIANIILIKRKK